MSAISYFTTHELSSSSDADLWSLEVVPLQRIVLSDSKCMNHDENY